MADAVYPSDVIAVKPQFIDVSDDVIQYYIDLAGLWVSDDWPDKLHKAATISAVCHLMTIDGLGTGPEAKSYREGTASFHSIKSGNVTLTRYQSQANGQSFGDWLGSTSCGRFLEQLMRMRFGGPAVAMGGSLSGYASGYAKDWPRMFWNS